MVEGRGEVGSRGEAVKPLLELQIQHSQALALALALALYVCEWRSGLQSVQHEQCSVVRVQSWTVQYAPYIIFLRGCYSIFY